MSGAVVLHVSLGWPRRWCRVSPSSTGFCVCAEGHRAACDRFVPLRLRVVCSFACVTLTRGDDVCALSHEICRAVRLCVRGCDVGLDCVFARRDRAARLETMTEHGGITSPCRRQVGASLRRPQRSPQGYASFSESSDCAKSHSGGFWGAVYPLATVLH